MEKTSGTKELKVWETAEKKITLFWFWDGLEGIYPEWQTEEEIDKIKKHNETAKKTYGVEIISKNVLVDEENEYDFGLTAEKTPLKEIRHYKSRNAAMNYIRKLLK